MAKKASDAASESRALIEEIRAGVFKPVYLLMGEEPYYPDRVCDEIVAHCVDEGFKDFNETICYGPDVTPNMVITAARRYPMMADRQLVVVKEAQNMKGLEELALYCNNPLDSTVLVLLLRGASADKRKSLYKSVQKVGAVLESPAIRDYEIARWIGAYYQGRGLEIDPRAAALLGESAGTNLSAIVTETDKLVRSLPEGTRKVTLEDIERNVGVSREFSIFELTRALSAGKATDALRLAARIGSAARFQMPAAVSALFTHFYRILRYESLLLKGLVDPEEKARVLGVNPYFFREYDEAVRRYPLPKTMAVVSLLCEYDYLGKGGDGGAATPEELLVELTAKILNT
ncbi:MAG: DNA polymerase III subunit delta [Bacteroidales bacterium]|nr:DNA polymerase III subunit delta [Bacteroidales bacterium]